MQAQESQTPPGSLADVLANAARRYGDKIAFVYSRDGEEETARITYRQLDARARAIGSTLLHRDTATGTALVLCPSGLDFIAAIFGCFYAGTVAIPLHPPVHTRLMTRVASIMADAHAGFVLTTAEVQSELKPVIDEMPDGATLQWCAVDTDVAYRNAGDLALPETDAQATAFVQYTSGSTGTPKGVQLTHGNLLANLKDMHRLVRGDDVRLVSWLPMHHDMGLIGATLEVIYAGGTAFLMPPSAFIQRPMRWLEMISRYRADISVAPNFAYDLCVERSTAEERAKLDLSHWTAALSGAEPVRAATMQRFTEAFAPAGFRQQAFSPVYGLAEATLLVSGEPDRDVAPTVRHIDKTALRDNRITSVPSDHVSAMSIVGCGRADASQEIIIVDPDTGTRRAPDEVGEIWIAGPNVANGYWGKEPETEETFKARTADTDEGPFLRTGDLGFLAADEELFVTGRLKDVVIIRGRNYHPTDIELTVQQTHSGLMNGRGAVFSVAGESGPEQLVVVQEVDRQQIADPDTDKVIAAIRTAITDEHQIKPHTILLVDVLRIPTTSSGKIRRSTCKREFVDGRLEAFAQWQAPEVGNRQLVTAATAEPLAHAGRSAEEIQAWFVEQLAADLGLVATEIDITQPFAAYGLDSVRSIQLMKALESWIGRELSPTLAYSYPTIEILADHLASDARRAEQAPNEPSPTLDADEPIAIIGIGCRFPGADGPSAYWRMLCDGVDAVQKAPESRWKETGLTADAQEFGGFLDQVDQFDAAFFGISPREAARMDPQQRLLLEVAWEALEDAGQVPDELAGGRVGVFTGISTNEYQHLSMLRPDLADAYSGTGTAISIAANRLSYTFDFRGPSMSIDTACSSSLVAVHLACRSLRDGESTLSLAGGVNVMLTREPNVSFLKTGVLATDGRCKTFDSRADGWVRGEGAGVVVLKRLSSALADGDSIYAVIRGSAVNQDGRTNGLMAPSRQSQESVLTDAYRRAGLSPGVVQYVEAQGTGTLLGDAVEADALGAVLAEDRAPNEPCMIGSVKTNIGHLEAASGIAGLIKVALALQHRTVPPTLNFARPNPNIPFDRLPLRVAERLTPWQGSGRGVAGVSAFGFGGTNAHVVLAEAPQLSATGTADDGTDDDIQLLPLSARSPEALVELAERYASALADGAPVAGLCYTAGVRRAHHDHRLAVVGRTRDELLEALAAHRNGQPHPAVSIGRRRPDRRPNTVFVFGGEGSEWCGMGRQLYAQEPAFRDALTTTDRALRPHLTRSVLTELLADRPDGYLDDVDIAGAAVFAMQVALTSLWRSWGIEPTAVIGHSIGEVAAAHVAGVLSLEDAARLICVRTRLVRRTSDRAARAELNEVLDDLSPQPAKVPVYSTVTGDALDGQLRHDAHWMANLRSPMRISSAIRRLAERGHDTFVEISPHPSIGEDAAVPAGVLLPSIRSGESERAAMLTSLANLYTAGHAVTWEPLHPSGCRPVVAPTYPWQRERFWLGDAAASTPDEEVLEPEVGLMAALSRANQRERQQLLTEYLRDHVAARIDMAPSRLDVELPLISFGIDSLIAAELRAQVECDTGIVVPLTTLLDGPSVVGLANWLAAAFSESGRHESTARGSTDRSVVAADSNAGTDDFGNARWSDLLTQVEEVSDDDVDALLREILNVGEAANDRDHWS
ncbi:beta-ketoacyl synthase N-terminal-like domain-containing protein [Mycobacterium sp. NPDC048908]|uniref:beta-ketoacyl synthase N-terminal-like domain-containing protein n=1 Tax=Mycobacterium sp. NPDC048908 TaxID=3364292 RepID=UPI00371E0984